MGDAAQGEPIQHEVFSTPFRVQPVFEQWKTPKNYRDYAINAKLPDQLKVWRVQNSGKTYGSVVSSGDSFDGFPDAEVLTIGYNEGKPDNSMGVGRHGNVLQWGFSGPPSQMTKAGKAFFINCICYIRKFDGKAPLVRRQHRGRKDAICVASISKLFSDPKFTERYFPADVLAKYKGKPKELARYYEQNIEWVYPNDRLYTVDEQLKSLGIESNRTVKALGQMIALLTDPQNAEAGRTLLKRYTNESFQTAEQWQAWLDANQARIYFTDSGGYKFLVVPEGYQHPLTTRPAVLRSSQSVTP